MNRPGVIIIDDEPDLVVELAEWFETQGWRVETGHSASDALRLLSNGRHIDCLITDQLMPSESGDELLRQLRALPRAVQPDLIAVMTGQDRTTNQLEPEGADVVFLKPVDPAAMLTSIAARLRTSLRNGPAESAAEVEFA